MHVFFSTSGMGGGSYGKFTTDVPLSCNNISSILTLLKQMNVSYGLLTLQLGLHVGKLCLGWLGTAVP